MRVRACRLLQTAAVHSQVASCVCQMLGMSEREFEQSRAVFDYLDSERKQEFERESLTPLVDCLKQVKHGARAELDEDAKVTSKGDGGTGDFAVHSSLRKYSIDQNHSRR